jgi:hypothetical protein
MLAAVFYGAMVYQLAGEPAAPTQQDEALDGVLALSSGTLLDEAVTQEEVGGALCTVTTRTYALADGSQALAVTASPAAYIERLSGKDVQMQLITGFVIDDLDAVYALRGGAGILAARSGDAVYMIEGPADQQALYELGALSRRETAQ